MTEQTAETPADPEEESAPDESADMFPRVYVEKLRRQSAVYRTEGQQAQRDVVLLREALQAAALREGCSGILREPVAWTEDFIGEDGLPSVERVREAAETLATEKPHLARVRGDAGQGFRGVESDSVNLAEVLRSGA